MIKSFAAYLSECSIHKAFSIKGWKASPLTHWADASNFILFFFFSIANCHHKIHSLSASLLLAIVFGGGQMHLLPSYMKSGDNIQLTFFFFYLFDANRNLQAEYDRLKQQHEHKGLSPLPSPPEMMPTSPQSPRDAELIAEAKLLRQHKGRLEARMQILEDHNKQLESQLHRLRQLLEQVRPTSL